MNAIADRLHLFCSLRPSLFVQMQTATPLSFNDLSVSTDISVHGIPPHSPNLSRSAVCAETQALNSAAQQLQ